MSSESEVGVTEVITDSDTCPLHRKDDNYVFQTSKFKIPPPKNCHVRICRPIYKTCDFKRKFHKNLPVPAWHVRLRKYIRESLKCGKKDFIGIFPIFNVIHTYSLKRDFLSDFISGVTVGFMQLPQGMAYALLANLPPVIGLYMGIFPVILYAIFGTSKHLSMGCAVVLCLFIGSVINKRFDGEEELLNASPTLDSPEVAASLQNAFEPLTKRKIKFAIALTFVSGIAQFLMGLLKMGLIVRLMPDSLVSGFSTGIAIYILSSQLKYILGVEVESFSGVFSIPKSLWATMKQLPDTNYPELLLSLISMVIIFLVKVHINDRFMSCLIAPIPIDLLIVILSTVVSAVLQLHEKHNFSITGDIPRGFPIPVIPDLNYADGYIGESVIIGIIGFAQSVSVAVVIARREGYTIDPNKELIAYGIMNVISPIFTCFAAAGALARSGVQHSSGGRTQIASIVGCIFVVLVVLAVGPLLRALPNCVLSAIIMVSLWPMFREIGNLRALWRISPYECYIWIGTFFGVIFTTVELGLVIGMVIGGATIIIRTQMVNFNRISVIEHTELFRNEFCYNVITPQCPVIILSFNSPLYYANVDAFQTRFKAKFTEFSKIQIDYETHIQCTCRGNGRRYIILDFSAISFVDAMGAKTLQQIFIDAKSEGITCIYTWLNEDVVMALEGADVYETFEDYCYVTTYDAVIAIQKGLVLPIREESDDEEKMVFRKRKTTLAEILAP